MPNFNECHEPEVHITPDWKWGTPEGSHEFDRLNDRRMSFVEKIQWLEEAETPTLAMRASRDKLRSEMSNGPPSSPGEP